MRILPVFSDKFIYYYTEKNESMIHIKLTDIIFMKHNN
jgi:hypothetical protein